MHCGRCRSRYVLINAARELPVAANHVKSCVLTGKQMDGKIKTINNQLGGYLFENHDSTANNYVIVVLALATGKR